QHRAPLAPLRFLLLLLVVHLLLLPARCDRGGRGSAPALAAAWRAESPRARTGARTSSRATLGPYLKLDAGKNSVPAQGVGPSARLARCRFCVKVDTLPRVPRHTVTAALERHVRATIDAPLGLALEHVGAGRMRRVDSSHGSQRRLDEPRSRLH